MRKADQVTGVVLLAFSALVVAESLRIPSETVAAGRTSFAPGAGFLPMWAGVILGIFSIALIVSAVRRPAAPEARALPHGPGLAAVAFTLLALVVYVAAFEWLGYVIATFLLNAFLLRVVMKAGWKSTLLTAMLVSAALYVVFHVLLGVALPRPGFAG